MPAARKPKVWKFASCDGCQLTLLDCEDELLLVTNAIEIADFREASSAYTEGPFDLTLVEGSVTTPEDIKRIHEIRAQSKVLVTISTLQFWARASPRDIATGPMPIRRRWPPCIRRHTRQQPNWV
jgi:hypothetical protein